MKDFVVTHWKWVMLGVIVVILFTGVWNEFAGVEHIKPV